MLSLTIPPAAVKNFMGSLLREAHFDPFSIRTIDLTLTTHITISGQLETTEETRKKNYTTWADMRPLVFDLIKRGEKPRMVKIVFSHTTPQEIHENAAALFLNMTYENDAVTFTTATAQQSFALEKSLDTTWDEWVQSFFNNKKIQINNNLIHLTDEA